MSYLELSLTDFIRAITNTPPEYEITVFEDGGESFTLSGTKDRFYELIKDIDKSSSVYKKLKRSIKSMDYEYFDGVIADAEIMNYLSKVTKSFDSELTQSVLLDFESFYWHEYHDRIETESLEIYEKEGWIIPKYCYVDSKKRHDRNGKVMEFCVWETMLNRTHFFEMYSIKFAISYLKGKINPDQVTKPLKQADSERNKRINEDGVKANYTFLLLEELGMLEPLKEKLGYENGNPIDKESLFKLLSEITGHSQATMKVYFNNYFTNGDSGKKYATKDARKYVDNLIK